MIRLCIYKPRGMKYLLRTTEPHSSPTSINIPSVDVTAVTISWQPPVLEDRNGIISFYVIVIQNLQFNIDDITVNVSGSYSSYTVSGLEEYCRYQCQIAAGTIIGSGPYSSYVEFLTMQGGIHHTISYHTISNYVYILFQQLLHHLLSL